jgi:galactosamine-6-phosphate isomerase
MFKPQVLADHEAVSQRAAAWMADRLLEKHDALFCLATGATPMRAYELLAQRRAIEPQLFDRMRVLKLDEWGGLPMNDPATCESHLRRSLVDPPKLADRYMGFESQPDDPRAECDRVALWLQQNGPIDVCVLGLGVNGHLGFNEPAESLQPHAHVAELSQESLSHAMIRERSTRPSYGLTLGMADVMQSRGVLLLVTGETKRRPLERLLTGPIATEFPASLLTLHPNVLLLCDEAAISSGPQPGPCTTEA